MIDIPLFINELGRNSRSIGKLGGLWGKDKKCFWQNYMPVSTWEWKTTGFINRDERRVEISEKINLGQGEGVYKIIIIT